VLDLTRGFRAAQGFDIVRVQRRSQLRGIARRHVRSSREVASTMRTLIAIVVVPMPTIGLAGTPAVDHAVSTWASARKPPGYRYALTDLNRDGLPDAIVLVSDSEYCGSGGWTLLVLKGTSAGFEVMSDATITREPIDVLREVWNSQDLVDRS
jgi:hypothetical protein